MHMNRGMAILLTAAFCVAGTVLSAERIGVVNVTRVFQASQKVQQIQGRLKEQFEGKRLELENKQKALQEDGMKVQRMQQQMKPEGSTVEEEKKLFGLMQDIQGREFDLKLQIREVGKEVEKVRMEEMRQVLKEIRAAIRDVGTAEKLDLILRGPEYDDEGMPNVGGEETPESQAPKTATALVGRFRENPVLYFASGVDITEKVITKLNADFVKAGGTPPKANK